MNAEMGAGWGTSSWTCLLISSVFSRSPLRMGEKVLEFGERGESGNWAARRAGTRFTGKCGMTGSSIKDSLEG